MALAGLVADYGSSSEEEQEAKVQEESKADRSEVSRLMILFSPTLTTLSDYTLIWFLHHNFLDVAT